jgi:hypothetical protein
MDDLKTEIEVTFETPVPYTTGGELVEATSVVLIAPSAKHLQYTAILKQGFFQAINSVSESQSKQAEPEKEAEMKGDDLLSMMYMAKDVDITKIHLAARELFKSGVGKLDGVQDLNQPLIDKISADDFEKMVGEYLINFILASALKKLKSIS